MFKQLSYSGIFLKNPQQKAAPVFRPKRPLSELFTGKQLICTSLTISKTSSSFSNNWQSLVRSLTYRSEGWYPSTVYNALLNNKHMFYFFLYRKRTKENNSPTPDVPIDPNEPTYCLCNQVSVDLWLCLQHSIIIL